MAEIELEGRYLFDAVGIFEELQDVVGAERLADYAADASGNDSLRHVESLVRTRLCRDSLSSEAWGAAWEQAMELIRKELAP